jgi:ATP-dependent DNA ligase
MKSSSKKSGNVQSTEVLEPMEALLVSEIPLGEQWQYEPKWDGFRCITFRDGDNVELQSKSGQSLTRYFPEVVDAVRKLKPSRFVLDGELVIPKGKAFSFDDLLQRIHPAASRVEKLARESPSILIVFDLLMDEKGRSLLGETLNKRRAKLEQFAAKYLKGKRGFDVSPQTRDIALARKWLATPGQQLDGVVAKRLDLPYQSGERTGMQKIKKMRTADCVVGGFRYASKRKVVGSLLLGLYDDEGLLHHVGFTAAFKESEREKLTRKLEPLIKPPGFTGNKPGGPSRWSTERSGEWEPLATKLVVEVQYDHFTGGRFRHGTRLLRWRPDKKARQCSFDQIK